MLTKIAVSAVAFITTNPDDICLLVLFFSLLKDKRQYKYVILGEYLGIATLDVLSMLSAMGLAVVLGNYIWIVGIVPLAFGIKALSELIKGNGDDDNPMLIADGLWILCVREWAITVANGGDNISVYLPILSSMELADFGLFFITMMAMTTIWWILAKGVLTLPKVADNISKFSVYVLPVVFISVGIITICRGIF